MDPSAENSPGREQRDEKQQSLVPACQRATAAQGGNIGTIVAKSKKAAATLWTLLHAKNCKVGIHRCSHPGCPEAKLLFLHFKTCPATLTEPCPKKHKGCDDSRKLLAHHKKCRELRARQAGQNTKTNQCLICSLVSRNAQSVLERKCSARKPVTKHTLGSPNNSGGSNMRSRSISPVRSASSCKSTVSFSFRNGNVSKVGMAPPPPRFPALSTQRSQVHGVSFSVSHASSRSSNDSSLLGRSVDSSNGFLNRPRADSLGSELLSSSNPAEHRRRRSASCSVLQGTATLLSLRSCDTISEEPLGEEIHQMLENNDDS